MALYKKMNIPQNFSSFYILLLIDDVIIFLD